MLTALLGIETYAVREGARIRNDKHRIDKFVSEEWCQTEKKKNSLLSPHCQLV